MLGAAMLVVGVVLSWELFVRAGGANEVPIFDSSAVWGAQRQRASVLGDEALVLVGGSRMQMGMDLDVLEERTGLAPVQLAISASPFVPVLEHLADDESVTGTVLVSFHMGNFVLSTRDSRSERWIADYDARHAGRASVFYQPVEDALKNGLARVLKSFDTSVRPQQMIGRSGGGGYLRTLPDRSQQADYTKTDAETAYRRRLELVLGGQEPERSSLPDFDARLDRLGLAVQRIIDRGGRVVFVRFPTTKQIIDIDETRFPRAGFWNRFAGRVPGDKLHFADHPPLGEFDLPDGVHLDVRDQPAFTHALLEALAQAGIDL